MIWMHGGYRRHNIDAVHYGMGDMDYISFVIKQ